MSYDPHWRLHFQREGSVSDPSPRNFATAFKTWYWNNFARDLDVIDVTDKPTGNYAANSFVPYASYYAVRADRAKLQDELALCQDARGKLQSNLNEKLKALDVAKHDWDTAEKARAQLCKALDELTLQRDDARAMADECRNDANELRVKNAFLQGGPISWKLKGAHARIEELQIELGKANSDGAYWNEMFALADERANKFRAELAKHVPLMLEAKAHIETMQARLREAQTARDEFGKLHMTEYELRKHYQHRFDDERIGSVVFDDNVRRAFLNKCYAIGWFLVSVGILATVYLTR